MKTPRAREEIEKEFLEARKVPNLYNTHDCLEIIMETLLDIRDALQEGNIKK